MPSFPHERRRGDWRHWARLGSPVAGGLVALLVSWAALGQEPAPAAAPTTTQPTGTTTPPPAPTTTPPPPPPSATTTTAPAPPPPGTSLGGCPNLPPTDSWHADVSALPVHPRSADYVAGIGADRTVKADFGSGLWEGGPIGIPVTYVDGAQQRVPVSFDYADESDRGPYPIPRDALIEGGPDSDGDRHVLVVDTAACRLYELWNAHPAADGSWQAGSGAVFDLNSHALRPAGWTSADAAGLPVAPGLVRYEEVAAGRIDHAIRVTVPHSQRAYLWPARHFASSDTNPALPPMGLRLRLKPTTDTTRLPTQARIVAEAMKTHGVIVADNGSPWYLSGAPDPRWDNDALRALSSLRGTDFEAVDTTLLMGDPNSSRTR